MRPDPVRGIRPLFTRELQALLRYARDDATTHIRNHFKYRTEIDVDHVREILERIIARRFLPDAEEVIRRFTRTAYFRGIDQSTTAIDIGARTVGTPVAISIGFTQVDYRAIDNLSAIQLTDLEGITAEMSAGLIHDLVAADKQGAGITLITKVIAEDFQDLGIKRIERIARTSLNRAYNDAAWTRISEYAPYKEWIMTRDSRTRPSHRAMQGVVIPVDDYFDVPGFLPSPGAKKRIPPAQMLFPGDISQNPHIAQIVNCRCALAPRFRKRD